MIQPTEFLLGLIGTGVAPSLTPPLHMQEGRALGLTIVDRPIDLAAPGLRSQALTEVLDWAERLGYDALNITHPCKQAVIPLLDRLDPVAESIGAVNTVLFTPNGRVGYNTDTTGFERAFRRELHGVETGCVVQTGAGGAGAAVADALLRAGADELIIVDLDGERAHSLAQSLRTHHERRVRTARPEELPDFLERSSGIVNCTPIGMHHHPGSPFDPSLLRGRQWVADIVYRPLRTELLQAAQAAGCRTMHGGHMAVAQAADTFEIVTGRTPDPRRMQQHFLALIEAEQP